MLIYKQKVQILTERYVVNVLNFKTHRINVFKNIYEFYIKNLLL